MAESIALTRDRVGEYVERSNAAPGQLAAQQATNELLAVQIQQLQEMQALEVAAMRAELERLAADASEGDYNAALRRAMHESHLRAVQQLNDEDPRAPATTPTEPPHPLTELSMTAPARTVALIATGIALTIAVAVTVTVVVTPPPAPPAPAAETPAADDPVVENAEQELRLEREAQEQRRVIQEGNRRTLDELRRRDVAEVGEGIGALSGSREEYERGRERAQQAARDAKAKANGFDSWDAYQQHLNATAADPK